MKKKILALALVASAVSMLSSCVVREGGYGYRYHHPHEYGYRHW